MCQASGAVIIGVILLASVGLGSSQLAIPTDEGDSELVARPTRWDLGFIRKFMIFFGPVSSVFDFITFGMVVAVGAVLPFTPLARVLGFRPTHTLRVHRAT
jgi:hypothetical protein